MFRELFISTAIVLGIATFIPALAQNTAEKWVELGVSQGNSIYLNTHSLRANLRNYNRKVSFVTMMVYGRPQSDGTVKSRHEYTADCANSQLGLQRYTGYSRNNQILKDINPPAPSYQLVQEGTAGERLYDIACKFINQ